MKASSIARSCGSRGPGPASRSIAFAATVGASFLASPALAQDAPPPLAAEPVPPSPTAPSGAESATPAAAPEAAPAAPPPPMRVEAPPVPAAAPAQTPVRQDEAVEPDDGKLRYHQDHWLGFIGFRVGKISSSGFDPFADSDELAQFSIGLGRTVMTAGNLSLVGLFLYDVGGRSSEARGATTGLTVHRLTLGAEGRYHFFKQLFVFGRVAPGTIHSIAKVEDLSTGVESQATRDWVFATDLSAGATFELSGWYSNARKRRPSAWITFEGGYGFATESELTLTPDGGGSPQRAEPLELGSLGLSGPFMRGVLVITY